MSLNTRCEAITYGGYQCRKDAVVNGKCSLHHRKKNVTFNQQQITRRYIFKESYVAITTWFLHHYQQIDGARLDDSFALQLYYYMQWHNSKSI